MNEKQLTNSLVIFDKGYIEEQKPDRYFKHLNGELLADDSPVMIKSIEDNTDIALTKDTLLTHNETYQELTRYESFYRQVVDEYPEYCNYIKGCLTPTAEDVSRNAEQYSIINWSKHYLGSNEVNIIPTINSFVQEKLSKYLYNNLHQRSEPSYILMVYASVLVAVPSLIRQTRMKNIGTHMMSVPIYLDTMLIQRGISNKIVSILTVGQKFWIYKNLDLLSNGLLTNAKVEEFADIIFERGTLYRLYKGTKVSNNGVKDTYYTKTLQGKLSKEISSAEVGVLIDSRWNPEGNPSGTDISSIYYIDNPYTINEILSPDLATNLWGHFSLQGLYLRNINFNYPFDNTLSTPYSLDVKTAYIYTRALLRYHAGVEEFGTVFEIADCLYVPTPSILKTDRQISNAPIYTLEAFLRRLEAVKTIYNSTYTEITKMSSDEYRAGYTEFVNYLASDTYPAPNIPVVDWIKENNLPLPEKEDIKQLIHRIKQLSIGDDIDLLTAQTRGLLLGELFDTLNSYTTTIAGTNTGSGNTVLVPNVIITVN